ncbi:MAG TPA: hypothetical protein VEB20_18905 [Azospirillaceae bacterium]|nr:hypothetical protein [Azospirillaceae bacterium]
MTELPALDALEALFPHLVADFGDEAEETAPAAVPAQTLDLHTSRSGDPQ